MNYELAKELKETGFPQGGAHYTSDGELATYCGETTDEDVYIPTLEELIEAFTENQLNLFQEAPINGRWQAVCYWPDPIEAFGKTPTEAVARLWLALKSEDKTTI